MNARNARLGLNVFIGVELMLFAALSSAFLLFQGEEGGMSGRPPFLPLALTVANTGVLLASGATAFLSLRALRRGEAGPFRLLLGTTQLLGLLFLGVQGTEWARLVHHGLTLRTGAFGGIFYLIVGLHALHVLGGLAWIAWVFRHRTACAPGADLGATLAVRYWGFVVALWPLLFGLLYVPRVG